MAFFSNDKNMCIFLACFSRTLKAIWMVRRRENKLCVCAGVSGRGGGGMMKRNHYLKFQIRMVAYILISFQMRECTISMTKLHSRGVKHGYGALFNTEVPSPRLA